VLLCEGGGRCSVKPISVSSLIDTDGGEVLSSLEGACLPTKAGCPKGGGRRFSDPTDVYGSTDRSDRCLIQFEVLLIRAAI
jgi:hypothetical protein